MNRAWVQEGGEGEGGKERSKERRAHFYSDIYVNKQALSISVDGEGEINPAHKDQSYKMQQERI